MKDTPRRLLILLAMAALAVPLAASDAIQRWRAERQLRALAPSACQSSVNPQKCVAGLARHHPRCLARGIEGTSPTGVVVNTTPYVDCILNPPQIDPGDEIRAHYGAAKGCAPNLVGVLGTRTATGAYTASGCGAVAYYRCDDTGCVPVAK